jgi:hypothetical protein
LFRGLENILGTGGELSERVGTHVPGEPGQDGAGMHGVDGDAVRAPEPVRLDGEQNDGGLRLAVGGVPVELTTLVVDVVELDRRLQTRVRADCDAPGVAG